MNENNAPVVTFGPAHPFWKTAIKLRQDQHTLQYILDVAQKEGFADLKYHQIGKALRNAPADLHLPVVTSKYLQKRYQQVSSDFDALSSLKDLAQEAMKELHDIEEELSDPDISNARKIYLEGLKWKQFGRAFDWTAKIAEIDVKLKGEHSATHHTVVVENVNGQDYLNEITEEFKKKIPSLPEKEFLALYGADNVRLPGVSVDSDVVDEEEE